LPSHTGAGILGQAMTDRMFRVPTDELCRARSGSGGSTYLYQSAWRSSGMGGILGAAHCVDVPFAFDNLDASGVEVALGADPPQALADQMHRAFVGFITGGDPGWPSFGAESSSTMIFDLESAVIDDPLGLPRSLWGTTA
jgi:carboxylesterase type B